MRGFILGLLGAGRVADAGEVRDVADELRDVGPAATLDDIPALSSLLERAGWEAAPELTGNIKPGDLFSVTSMGHQWQAEGCFATTPRQASYTQVEVTSQLSAGVRVGGGLVSGGAGGELVRKIKFGTPSHIAIAGLYLEPSEDCVALLTRAAARGTDLHRWYVVKEVLMAEIAEQVCGRVDAGGRIVGLGAADAELAMACSQTSLDPVTVAIRTVPVVGLAGMEALAPAPAAPPARAEVAAPATAPDPPGVAASGPARADGFYSCSMGMQPAFIVYFSSAVYADVAHLNERSFRAALAARKGAWATKAVPFNSDTGSFLIEEPGYSLIGAVREDGALDLQWTMKGLNVMLIGASGTDICPFVPM
jgi:hypothetical protein